MDRNVSILLADDDPINLKLLESTLKKRDYELLTAMNGEEAIQIAQESVPDLILLDIKMPGIDGFEVCRSLKEMETTEKIPIIFLTASEHVEDKVKAFETGGVDYITKPFQREGVIARVENHLEISRLTQELTEALEKQRKLSEKLRELSIKDPLTTLYNRRYFFERMDEEIKRAMRREELMAIAIFDIDHFKDVNDTYGHWCGDFVLKALSSLIRKEIRETDLLARYGGEEFVVAFLDIEPDSIKPRLEALRKTIESRTFVFDENQINKTISIGYTVYKFDRDSSVEVELLINKADKALYHAKETGRNKVVHFADLTR